MRWSLRWISAKIGHENFSFWWENEFVLLGREMNVGLQNTSIAIGMSFLILYSVNVSESINSSTQIYNFSAEAKVWSIMVNFFGCKVFKLTCSKECPQLEITRVVEKVLGLKQIVQVWLHIRSLQQGLCFSIGTILDVVIVLQFHFLTNVR